MQKNEKIYNNIIFVIFIIVVKNDFYFSQIYDDFSIGILEESELLDVTDYYNIHLIVTTSKNIYTGIPPVIKTTTNAELINATSLMTLNENYLLAACLQDSLLTKININNGDHSPLLNYSDIDSSLELDIPITSCSLSLLENTIFIGYTKIIYYEDDSNKTHINKTNIVIKLNITNKNSDSGPDLDTTIPIKYFIFPESSKKTDSSRQILCEPLKVKNDINDYRLICLYENYEDAEDSVGNYRYYIYATSINKNFDGFENNMRENRIYRVNDPSGFKIIKINDTDSTCTMKKQVYDLFLEKNEETVMITKIKKNSNINQNLDALNDLFDYNNNLLLFSSKKTFMKKNDIYFFRIHKENTADYFILYDYNSGVPKKLLCYHNNINDYILVVYQYSNNIKYFYLLNSNIIYNLDYYSKIIQIKSNEQIEFNINELIDCSSLGNLNILEIEKNTTKTTKEAYGNKFYDFKISDNLLNHQETTNNAWFKYSLGFIEHEENNYTRFYSSKVNIIIRTCSYLCGKCSEDFYKCDECRSEDYILLNDNNNICYPKNQLLQNYIYNETINSFEPCYQSCDFCFEKSEDNSEHKCESCAEGYFPSYIYQGNCYKINDLQINEDKKIANINDESFTSSNCQAFIINSTGECVEECPTISNYYSFKSNNINFSEITEDINDQSYEKTLSNPPKYLFNRKCYDLCPSNSIPDDTRNICKCELSFILDNNGEYICYPDTNCPSDYPYQNQNTYECYESLNHCSYFFNKYCYDDQCPEGKIALSSKSEDIKNYYKNNLLLDNNLIDKLCICDTSNGTWNNITSNEDYFQECLIKCPEGYKEEPITRQCIEKSYDQDYPDEYYKNSELCLVIYDKKCYLSCPEGTCLDQDDPFLMNCILAEPDAKIFNNICFTNFDQFTNNIQSMSDNNNVITTESGITIRAYSTSSFEDNVDNNAKYSIVDLGNCENKIRNYYNLSKEVELFILGVDSPNKNKSYTTSVYNFGVYFENGTQIDHESICKDEKILISSYITNTESVNLDEANYFSSLGYDIYNESSEFYTDNCAPASIDGNDITLEDRKKDFYPSDISLCNESCYYVNVNFNNKRFTCECDLISNSEEKTVIEENIDEEGYFDYFLSLISYKIFVCYELFFDYKSYYYNAGFYISVGTLIYCLVSMVIFLTLGMKDLNIIIWKNRPNKKEIIKEMREKLNSRKKLNGLYTVNNYNPPNKKNFNKKIIKKQKNSDSTLKINTTNNALNNRTNTKNRKKNGKSNPYYIATLNNIHNKKSKNNKQSRFNKIKNKRLKGIDNIFGIDNLEDEKVDKKELNIIPYTQALRIDKRNYRDMFLSVLAHELGIIDIFYYRNVHKHLSIVLSIYVFELCLDLALNCLLYTDDVVSEKYNNNGSIQFFTSLSLSFMSNMFASIIAFIVAKLAEYTDPLDLIIANVIDKKTYFETIKKFKKYLSMKLTGFFILQGFLNIGMCYYLMIFCTVYHNSQGSIMINYIVGVAESIGISFGLSIIISLIRFLSLKYKWKNIYNTSKYLFDNF